MDDIKVVMKEKGAGSTQKRVLLGSSSDVVYRPGKDTTIEADIANIEKIIPFKVDGTTKIYSNPVDLKLTSAATPTEIFNAMSDNSIATFSVTAVEAGPNYPAKGGAIFAIKISNEYSMAFYQAANTNKMYTGTFYKSISGESSWSDWKTYELDFDTTPTVGSNHPVTSDGIKAAITAIYESLSETNNTTNEELTKKLNDTNAALSSHAGDMVPHITPAERDTWNAKQSALTFDNTPTDGSTNPVTSSGIKAALDTKSDNTHHHDSAYAPKTIYDEVTGLILPSALPSYVDDIIEGTVATFPTPGETGKIYVDTTTNLAYRWSGSQYTEVSQSIALGETSSTAYRGDLGKTAYDHSQSAHARVDATKVTANSNGVINIDETPTTIYTHPAYPTQTPAGAANLAFGGTFAAITQIINDNGHTTTVGATTFRMPDMPEIPSGTASGTTQPTNQKEGDLWFETIG